MDPWMLGLAFVLGGIFLLLLEAATPGFFVAIPGTVLIVIGVIGMLAPDALFSYVAPVVAVAITIPVTVATIWFYKRLAPPENPTTTVGDSLVGKEGIVTHAVLPDSIKGKVKIDSTIWSARKPTPGSIEKGVRVKVVASEGVHVIVEAIETAKEKNSKNA